MKDSSGKSSNVGISSSVVSERASHSSAPQLEAGRPNAPPPSSPSGAVAAAPVAIGPVAAGPVAIGTATAWLPLAFAMAGGFFYWLSLPPMKQPWAAFVSSFFWSAVVLHPTPLNRKSYWAIYGVGCLTWLTLLQGIRLAFWPLYGGWVALSLYLAVYFPLFVGSARLLRSLYRVPFPLACALSWTGMELIRSYFATGFAGCLLGHAMTPWPILLDIAAHFGMYGVSFFIMLLGASICYLGSGWMFKAPSKIYRRWYIEPISTLFSILLVGCWLLFSLFSFRLHELYLAGMQPIKPLGRFLIVQGSMPTMFESNVESLVASWSEYARQTRSAVQAVPDQDIDVVLWPESTFDSGRPLPWSYFDWDRTTQSIPEWGIESQELAMIADETLATKWSRLTPDTLLPIAYLVGGGALELRDHRLRRYNTALWITPSTDRPMLPNVDYYSKRHLVMFGEYIPVLSWFPDLLAQFGMGTLDAGERFVGWKTRSGCTIAPSVCFENMVPQLIQRQIQSLKREGNSPDVLVNVTNDAWFRGTSLLDHHLNNAIGCAVENRKPMLVAANDGISAWIDSTGTVIEALERSEVGTILAEPIPDARWGLWQEVGDAPAKVVAFIAVLPWVSLLLFAIYRRARAT